MFLVASGTAQIGDAGLVSQNYSIQDTITNNVFVYYYGDPDGEGLGIWTRFDKDEPVIPNYSIDSDMDSTRWLDWDYYNTPGLPFGTQATVENTAMGYVTSVAPQIWEFQMAPSNIRYLSTVAESVAADHVFWNSNTSRMPSAEEMLALYAANFGGDLGGHGWPSGPASTVGNIQPMTDESTNNKYTDIESNRPGGFLADYWSTARTFWGRLDFNIYEGHLFDFPEVTSRGVAPIL